MNGFTHEPPGGGKPDWYTPPWIFEGLGCTFDLDPCSPPGGLPWIPATETISLPDNGLDARWRGTVWLNPPYGKETPLWLGKMAQHDDGIALVFSRTDTKWFHEALSVATGVLFMKERVRFIDSATMEPGGSPGCGSVLIAYGSMCAHILKTSSIKGTFLPIIPDWFN